MLLLPIAEVPPAFATHGLLLPRGPFAATPPRPAPQRLSTHGLPSSRRGIKRSLNALWFCPLAALGRLFLLSEMLFPLPSPWSYPQCSSSQEPHSPGSLPGFTLFHSSLPGPSRFLSARLMSPPGRDWLFLIQCPISGHSCNAVLAPELGQGQRDTGSSSAGCGVCGSEGPDVPEV